jgi:Gas vesicle synthesis protein GvpL/GvpF
VDTVLYVYAVTRDAVTPDCEAIDQTRHFGSVSLDGIAAVFTSVSAAEMSQEAIDRRSADLEWLGAIGYRHQAVVSELMKRTAIVPLRAFTLFSTAASLRAYLEEHRDALAKALDRLDGKQEWTLRIELEPERWSEALVRRVASLRGLKEEIESATPGKAFLLRKKLDDEKKRASREAEEQLVAEIETAITTRLRCDTIAESRERRDGAFPQINVLLNRDEDASLRELQDELGKRYEADGVTIAVTGPWPPYTFANG